MAGFHGMPNIVADAVESAMTTFPCFAMAAKNRVGKPSINRQ
jgi:hypothetical protein